MPNSLIDKVKSNVRRWLGISDPIQSENLKIERKVTREAEAFFFKVLAESDMNDIEAVYKQLWSDDKWHFWSSPVDRKHPICKRHSGLPSILINSFHNIISECYENVNIDDKYKEALKLWTEAEKNNQFNELFVDMVDDVLTQGDCVVAIDLFTELKGHPKLKVIPSQFFNYIDENTPECGVIIYEHYFVDNEQYTLEETREPGRISWKLYQKDKEVPLSRITFTEKLESINPVVFGTFQDDKCLSQSDLRTYEVFKFSKNKKYKNRGASIFAGKIDAYDSLDLTVSSFAQNTLYSWPRIYMPSVDLKKNMAGKVNVRGSIYNSVYEVPVLNVEKSDARVSVIQGALNSAEYQQAASFWLEQCITGVISPSTLGFNSQHYNSQEDIREKEKDTLYTYNSIKKMLQRTIPDLIFDYIEYCNFVNKTNIKIEKDAISVSMDEYSNPSFESQVETIKKAAPDQTIMAPEDIVEELYGATITEEEKAEKIRALYIINYGVECLEDMLDKANSEKDTEQVSKIDFENKAD